jgi:hypothetical protein
MTPIRLSTVVTTVLKMARSPRPAPVPTGPGCTCESCMQAWNRHHPPVQAATQARRRLAPGIY